MSTTKRLVHCPRSEELQHDFPLFRFLENFKRGVELYNLSQIKKNSTLSTVNNFDDTSLSPQTNQLTQDNSPKL